MEVSTAPSLRPVRRAAAASVHLAYADALRALAILCVVAYHLTLGVLRVPSGKTDGFEWLGVWGVACFFVLSGYLLGRDYLRALIDPHARFPSLRRFLQRRFLRIYPLYAVAVAFSAVSLGRHHAGSMFVDVATHLTMTHGFFVRYVQSLSPPLWTMAVDAQFYLALPLAAFALVPFCRGRSTAYRVSLVTLALVAVAALGIAARYFVALRFPHVATDVPSATVACRNVFGMSGGFALGGALALFEMRRPKGRRPRRTVAAAALLGGVLLAYELARGTPAHSPLAVATYDFEAALSAVAILAGMTWARLVRLETAARSRSVTGAAAIAYAIYLFHWPVIRSVEAWLPKIWHLQPGSAPFSVALVVVSAALIVPLAALAHRFVERPFLSLKERTRSLAVPEASRAVS